MTCDGAVNVKGEHVPCDLEAPHVGLACSNKEHQMIWKGGSE